MRNKTRVNWFPIGPFTLNLHVWGKALVVSPLFYGNQYIIHTFSFSNVWTRLFTLAIRKFIFYSRIFFRIENDLKCSTSIVRCHALSSSQKDLVLVDRSCTLARYDAIEHAPLWLEEPMQVSVKIMAIVENYVYFFLAGPYNPSNCHSEAMLFVTLGMMLQH